ncbi:MAG: hypothetical protein WC479_04485 [Candidatus Izemoplasmatales bacterium]|jgi:hypothetical protein
MAREIINPDDIVEQVFLDLHYQLVQKSQAVFVRIRLKNGRSIIGIVSEDDKLTPTTRVVLNKEQELQHAS